MDTGDVKDEASPQQHGYETLETGMQKVPFTWTRLGQAEDQNVFSAALVEYP